MICSINQLLRCVAIYLVSILRWFICYLLLGFDPLLKTCCCKNRHYYDWFSVFCPQLHSISGWGLTTPLKSYINMYIQLCLSHLCWTMHQVRCYDHNHKFIWIKTVNVNKHPLLNMSTFKNTQRKIQLNIQLGFFFMECLSSVAVAVLNLYSIQAKQWTLVQQSQHNLPLFIYFIWLCLLLFGAIKHDLVCYSVNSQPKENHNSPYLSLIWPLIRPLLISSENLIRLTLNLNSCLLLNCIFITQLFSLILIV